jgi:RNA polymerase sigma-70 factor (ECF subfamily)
MASLNREKETELVKELLEGSITAFDRFVELYRTRIFRYSLLMCGHHDDAEDVAQDSLLKIFENLGQLRDPERVHGWVFRIVRNACLMKRRKSVFAPTQELSLDELMPSHDHRGGGRKIEIADWSAVPDSYVLQTELKRELETAIRDLPEIYRSVIVLRDIEQLSTGETARILDISEDAVKTRLHRARLAVRQRLDKYLRTHTN